jgi:hypothetical protein
MGLWNDSAAHCPAPGAGNISFSILCPGPARGPAPEPSWRHAGPPGRGCNEARAPITGQNGPATAVGLFPALCKQDPYWAPDASIPITIPMTMAIPITIDPNPNPYTIVLCTALNGIGRYVYAAITQDTLRMADLRARTIRRPEPAAQLSVLVSFPPGLA